MEEEKIIRILFAGDFSPFGDIENAFISGKCKEFFSSFQNILDHADFRVVNLECPLTESNLKIKKTGPNLKAVPATVELLKEGKFDLVTLANNHILDYGEQGMFDTIQHRSESTRLNSSH